MNIEEQIHAAMNRALTQCTDRRPKLNLYVGTKQWHALQDATRRCRVFQDPGYTGGPMEYSGMFVFRVFAKDHLEVHEVQP